MKYNKIIVNEYKNFSLESKHVKYDEQVADMLGKDISSYIQKARKNLALWAETIDDDTFTEQYKNIVDEGE